MYTLRLRLSCQGSSFELYMILNTGEKYLQGEKKSRSEMAHKKEERHVSKENRSVLILKKLVQVF